jgi:hypothetical protein
MIGAPHDHRDPCLGSDRTGYQHPHQNSARSVSGHQTIARRLQASPFGELVMPTAMG